MRFNRCPPQCHPIEQQDPTIGQFLPIDAWETQNDNYLDYTDHSTDVSQCIVAHKAYYFEPMICKMTVSTTLAKGEEHKTTDIPPEFHKYVKVFSDEEAQQLPKHQPWDHKIDLQPGLQMRKTSVYRLTPPVETYYCLWRAVGNDLVFEVEVIDPKDNQRDMTKED